MDTYVNQMNEILGDIKNKNITPNLLLHSCCAPCSSTCIEQLTDYFNITVFYYNPNIEPVAEYEKRKEEQKSFISRFPSKNKLNIIDCDYDNKKWHHFIHGYEKHGEGSERCYRCYVFRLDETARQAKINNFDYFATTLTLSPYKNIKWLNDIGVVLEHRYDVKYLPSHFGDDGGVDRSCELSEKYGLYQQTYCGCVYSKMENNTMEQVFDTMEKTNITYKI